ncbi:hypothetical protein [Streptomyces atroolivaceus]|uniref:Uncharacterized protein n=1 Tax=Streptomyces atroolivaceus TaxID=66869 RepID=A0ABV9VIY6_STRAZ|nr:hypothetical protein [Streptomyces atroolivaceus]
MPTGMEKQGLEMIEPDNGGPGVAASASEGVGPGGLVECAQVEYEGAAS